jgi:lysyl-tRNA synthetase class 2
VAEELSRVILNRRQKIQKLLASGEEPFKSKYKKTHEAQGISEKYCEIKPGDQTTEKVKIAGRLMTIRRHGKATFADLKDASGKIQLFATLDQLGEKKYPQFLELDIGDIIGVEGFVFKTRRGELSIKVENFTLLSKSVRPLPEKWHGLKDIETRYRQRYVDLIINPHSKDIFMTRVKIIKAIREFLDAKGFIEVETPMLQPIPGGAAATPFVTYHQALDMQLYLRIAPELYLKRLIVGGLEKIYELNRSFRNEGISVRHNPEFTMLEVYAAYNDYKDMMRLTEDLIKYTAKRSVGTLQLSYQGEKINLAEEWPQLTMIQAIKEFADIEMSLEQSKNELAQIASQHGVEIKVHFGKGQIINEIFEKLVEPKITQPTFITDYPVEISPLARRKPDNPDLTERFELIIAGLEVGTAFSELNNPFEQRERFEEQLALREAGFKEVQRLDEDFIRALEYGMPPTGGLGIGIDRLTMILTDNYSIREVIAFPHLKPEKSD